MSDLDRSPALPLQPEMVPRGEGRRRLVSIGHLLSGNFLNAGIMLVGVAIAARALGPASYGVMVLVLAFGRTVERLLRFESWQPLIRFAAEEEIGGQPARLARLYAYGLALDVASALVAATVTVAIAVLCGRFFGLDLLHVELVAVYAIALVFNINGMPTAALRMAGRFRTIAYSQIAANVFRVALALLCWWSAAGVMGFVAAWTAAQVAGSLLFFWLGLRALRMQGIASPFTIRLRDLKGSFPGFMGFAWSTNLSTTLRTLTHEADALLVGLLAGPAAAGFYHIAKRIAKVAQQVGAQVQTVVYPDVARMWSKGEIGRFRSTTLQVQAALGAIGIAMLAAAWLLGDWIIRLGPGEAYRASYPLLLTQFVAVIPTLYSAPSRSALLAMGQAQRVLWIALVGTIAFFATAWLLIPTYGAMGANIGHIVLAIVTALLMDVAWLRGSRTPVTLPRKPSSD